jgi:diacylglycerol kinase
MKNILKSFKYALRGLKVLALAERNFKIETL